METALTQKSSVCANANIRSIPFLTPCLRIMTMFVFVVQKKAAVKFLRIYPETIYSQSISASLSWHLFLSSVLTHIISCLIVFLPTLPLSSHLSHAHTFHLVDFLQLVYRFLESSFFQFALLSSVLLFFLWFYF